MVMYFVFFFKQKTAYEMRISDWSSDVCSSDLHGYLGVLRLDGGGHVGRRQLVLVQLERIHPDAHGIAGPEDIDAADTLDTLDLVFDAGGEDIAEVDGTALFIGRYERADHQDAGCRARHRNAGLLDDIRQLRLDQLQLVLHLDLGNFRIDRRAEGQGDRSAAGAGSGGHIGEVVEAGHAVLDDARHRFLHGLGAGAIIRGGDADRGRRDIGILRYGEGRNRSAERRVGQACVRTGRYRGAE